MSRYLFHLPDVGEGVAQAEITAWHVRPGDAVREDQSLVDIMTDKATLDMTSPVDGTVVAVNGDVGSMQAVGAVLVEFEVGEPSSASDAPADETHAPATERQAPASEPTLPQIAASASEVVKRSEPYGSSKARESRRQESKPAFANRSEGEAPLAAPATRRRAFDLGIPLQFVPGSGPGGRITPEDLDAYIAAGGSADRGEQAVTRDDFKDIRIIGLRRKIADKVQQSKRRIPHITYVEECDLTELEALRGDFNKHRQENEPKLTLLPFFMRALVRALSDYPQFNARYDDDAGVLRTFAGVHIGIATQTRSGLIVPVVRNAEALDLWGCASEVVRVAAAARDGSAKREELSGSTITITSLGPLAGIMTTPVINHPEVAIIGPNKMIDRPVVQGSMVAIRKMMNLSSSFDHRIVDGHDAALFVQSLKRMFEHPALMFMEHRR